MNYNPSSIQKLSLQPSQIVQLQIINGDQHITNQYNPIWVNMHSHRIISTQTEGFQENRLSRINYTPLRETSSIRSTFVAQNHEPYQNESTIEIMRNEFMSPQTTLLKTRRSDFESNKINLSENSFPKSERKITEQVNNKYGMKVIKTRVVNQIDEQKPFASEQKVPLLNASVGNQLTNDLYPIYQNHNFVQNTISSNDTPMDGEYFRNSVQLQSEFLLNSGFGKIDDFELKKEKLNGHTKIDKFERPASNLFLNQVDINYKYDMKDIPEDQSNRNSHNFESSKIQEVQRVTDSTTVNPFLIEAPINLQSDSDIPQNNSKQINLIQKEIRLIEPSRPTQESDQPDVVYSAFTPELHKNQNKEPNNKGEITHGEQLSDQINHNEIKQNTKFISTKQEFTRYETSKTASHEKVKIIFDGLGSYEGGISRGKLDGYGILSAVDLSILYEGEFEFNQFNGVGIIYNNPHENLNGWKFEGRLPDEWIRYEGLFLANKRQGFGDMYFKDESHYSGEFSNDKANGFGTFISKNAEKFSGIWKDGALEKRVN